MATLAIIDDEENVLRAIQRILRKKPWKVLIFSDPYEAIDALKKEPVDLVISDYRMPEMNGVELLNSLKDVRPEALRILLSGQADIDGVTSAINDAEIYRFISKPWSDEDLLMTLENALEHNALVRENRRLLELVRKQEGALKKQLEELQRLEAATPGITQVSWNEDGSIDLIDEDFDEL
ncbi:FOG: CheY-like receiver [Hahella chejuensis KCTC 2396]|uniref:FOG: CheY-like receiver n=1 Tax=Hahella chejuensis (strain KCTC 2396) TaxID=349521 RepID=Q2SF33_HAHCH|nr:response regulator [Hahella chejuensis]ABC30741.1 FOG: CheY-like receiver [Hahella chejuensis KCTC 2396]